jgi:hypothetical protein
MKVVGPRSHSVNARLEKAGRQICRDGFRSHASEARIARRVAVVSAQARRAGGSGKSPKARALDQPAGQNQTKIQEKLKAYQAKTDCSSAMAGEPPDAEEKQDAEQKLVTVQDRQCRNTEDGKNQKSRAK